MATKELPAGSQSKDDQQQQQPPQPVKKRSRFKIIMVVGSLLLLLGGGGGAGYWWLYMRPDATGLSGLFGGNSDTATETSSQATPPGAEGSKTGGEQEGGGKSASGAPLAKPLLKPVSLPSLTVNLADPSGSRYFKIGLDVELNSEGAIKEIQDQTARIRDSIIVLLSSKTVQELITAEGKVLLKNEIAARLNQILGAPRVVRIFFTEFVIQ